MKQDHKTHHSNFFLVNQKSGQAVVEYILIIAITVSLIIGLKNTFNQAGKFFENYIGAYTECLMDYGELPSFGVSDEDLKKHLSDGRKCEAKFENFTMANGRALKGDASGGPDKEPSQNASSNSDSESNKNRSRNGQSDSAGSSSGGGGSGDTDGRVRSAASVRRTSDGGSNTNAKVKTIEEEGSGDQGLDSSGRGGQSRTIYRDRGKYKAVTGKMAEQILKSDKGIPKRAPTTRTLAKADDSGGNGLGPRISIVQSQQQSNIKAEEDKPVDWGMGNFLKWILIIGMIVAIVVFFGGQILNYSNSDST